MIAIYIFHPNLLRKRKKKQKRFRFTANTNGQDRSIKLECLVISHVMLPKKKNEEYSMHPALFIVSSSLIMIIMINWWAHFFVVRFRLCLLCIMRENDVIVSYGRQEIKTNRFLKIRAMKSKKQNRKKKNQEKCVWNLTTAFSVFIIHIQFDECNRKISQQMTAEYHFDFHKALAFIHWRHNNLLLHFRTKYS